MVDDLGNGSNSAFVWTATEVDDTANLDVAPRRCGNGSVAHCDVVRWSLGDRSVVGKIQSRKAKVQVAKQAPK